MRFRALLGRLVSTEIRSERELIGYVARTTLACVLLAVGFDVINQLTFFVDWPSTLRSWAISAAIAFAIAAPVSRAIGKANLALFRAKHAVELLSRTDPLTGLANRRALLEWASSAEPSMLALVIVDIDRFKTVNDTHGHAAGDHVLATVARMMEADLGELGGIGRLGGEEFALIAQSASGDYLVERLWAFCQRIAGTPVMCGDAVVKVTVSAGVAERRPGQDFDTVYAAADRALYMAKAAGRNRVVRDTEVESLAKSLAGQGRRDEDIRRTA